MSGESIEQLKALNYPVKIYFDEKDKVFVAEYLDLPGCTAYGETIEEAYRHAEEAKADWLRISHEQGLPIPKPSQPEEYSGRILVRLPSSLHAMLADKANLHGASVNQYIVHLLSGAVVGDAISLQLDELKSRIAQLEWRIAELGLRLRQQYASMGTIVVSTAVPSTQSGAFFCAEHEDWGQNFLLTHSKVEEGHRQELSGSWTSAVTSDRPSIGRRAQRARTK
jgi:antitoxin HicB